VGQRFDPADRPPVAEDRVELVAGDAGGHPARVRP
jgi:hypothetical protein